MRARPLAALLFGSVRAHADMIGTLRRLQAESGPLILAVLHDHGGGAERHVLELARLLRGQARFLVLRPTWSRRVSLRSADETEPLELHFRLDARRDLPGVVGAGDDCGDDYEALLTALRGLGVCHVHIHQRMGHSRAILDLPRRLGVSYDYTLHDYYPICPRITLSGGGGGGGAMAPPRSPASHGALPPEGAAPPWERPGDGAMVPPRSPASHGALPPEGAVPSWERPGDGAMVPPRSPAAHGALPPEGAVPSWERPGDGYCGEQGLGQCRACLPDGPDIVEWRDENAALILRARWVIAPSRDALARLLRYVPAATAVLVPHTDIDLQAPLPEPRPPTLEGGRPLRVAVIGALGVHKGAKVLEAAAVAAGKTGAPVEFHLLGYSHVALAQSPPTRLRVHGRYDDASLPKLLRDLRPDVVWFPALWPETYCYTLSACLQGGWPVAASAIGAFAERLAGRRWSWLKPWDTPAAQWLEFFIQIRQQHFCTGNPPAPLSDLPSSTRPKLPSGHWYAGPYLAELPRIDPASKPALGLDTLVAKHAAGATPALAQLVRRARNALRYVARGDFEQLRRRIGALWRDRASKSHSPIHEPRRWAIMATPHTLFIAHLMAGRLRRHGWQVDVMTEAPPRFTHDVYVVICPQMFRRLPPGKRRIAFQMEQSISPRWFSGSYLRTLKGSLAVIDYSLKNIEFLAGKGISYPQVHYLPIGSSHDYMTEVTAQPIQKKWDLLFYGDTKHSARRRHMLEVLQKNFNVRICSEVFGENIAREILQAQAVINIHYYENALLEMPRIQECLSLGVPVISESSADQGDYPEILDAVTFFEAGNEQDMLRAVRAVLQAEGSAKARVIERAVAKSSLRFGFMFDRFLTALNFLAPTQLVDADLPLPDQVTRIALSLPETIVRRRIYQAAAPRDCAVFDGIRLRPGWVGCGLSYSSLARHALGHGLRRLTILEDDALLPEDFESKFDIINAYLDSKGNQWDIFAGLIANVHSETKILSAEYFQGMRFITINRMTSTVCNIYNERALQILSEWDLNDHDEQTNTIDRFIERRIDLRVAIALPFFVGHREDVYSTLWGVRNTQYNDAIKNSEQLLEQLAKSSWPPC